MHDNNYYKLVFTKNFMKDMDTILEIECPILNKRETDNTLTKIKKEVKYYLKIQIFQAANKDKTLLCPYASEGFYCKINQKDCLYKNFLFE